MPKQQHTKVRLGLTGFSMGLADLVPGVSGGTVALLFGIYDELLYSIRVVTGQAVKLALRGKIRQAITAVPFAFLVPLFIGIFIAIFGMVQIVTYLLENHPVPVWSLFFGLVLGSAYVVSKKVGGWNRNRGLLSLAGFVATFLLVGLPVFNFGLSPLVMFGTGAIAICAMILPGISGSLIMVILGQYENVINAVADRQIGLLVAFGCGAVTGLALFSRLLSWLLHNHHGATIAVLVGVMVGSLRKVWPWQIEVSEKLNTNVLPDFSWGIVGAVVLAVVGFLLVWRLEKLGLTKDHNDINDKTFKQELRTQHD